MRSVMVVLDGTHFRASIIPDALRYAGRGGELVLTAVRRDDQRDDGVQEYLWSEACALQELEWRVRTIVLPRHNTVEAATSVLRTAGIDMVAMAAHGYARFRDAIEPSGDGPVWNAILHSPVPVLLRHPHDDRKRDIEHRARRTPRILVPLDRTERAERALPMAAAFARERGGSVILVTSLPRTSSYIPVTGQCVIVCDWEKESRETDRYLRKIAARLDVPTTHVVVQGSAADTLDRVVQAHDVTDVIMTCQKRGSVARALMGSVTADLLHRLHRPMVVVPACARVPVDLRQEALDAQLAAGA